MPELPLRDIILPAEIGIWPPALGWWLLLILIPALGYGLWRVFKKITAKTVFKSAASSLAEIRLANTDDQQTLLAISAWLRRVAMSLDGRENCASLTGKAWLNYLDEAVVGTPFSEGVGISLSDAAYRPKPAQNIDIEALLSLCDEWLKGVKK